MTNNNQDVSPGLNAPKDFHDFQESLQRAEANSTLLQLDVFYKSNFPRVSKVEKEIDRTRQRQGIDTVLTLESGKTVYFDEKIREEDYGDILLEEISVWRNYPFVFGNRIGKKTSIPKNWREAKPQLKPGWISGDKHTDYITYVIKPSRKVYFLPFLLLQRAWIRHYHAWLCKYGRIPVKNETYITTNIPIPTEQLYRAIFEEAKWSCKKDTPQ